MPTVIREHLHELEERIAADDPDRRLPGFVKDALSATASCGDFTAGFAWLSCDRCHEKRVVFVFLQSRTRICPSCAGRTMADRAAHLVDRVLRQEIRWRQWVFA